jgi:DNA repair exonuclease SbcCD nuclease subunit
MLTLVVGDVHCTPGELPDCQALLQLVAKVADEESVPNVIFMGDLYNSHAIVNSYCIEFWKRWLDTLAHSGKESILLVGNHDQVSPSCNFPHALLAHSGKGIRVIDEPTTIGSGLGFIPYCYDPQDFLKGAQALLDQNVHTLFCHQTMAGARYESGFYANDAVDVTGLPFRHIISGHIHTPQTIGAKVLYVGSPRWRTLSDAGASRYLWIFEHTEEKTVLKKRIPTDTVCRQIYSFTDTEKEPAAIPKFQLLNLADIRVKIYGTSDYISKRSLELKAQFNARCRGFPERPKLTDVSESEGIGLAFERFAQNFKAPNGSDLEKLKQLVKERMR